MGLLLNHGELGLYGLIHLGLVVWALVSTVTTEATSGGRVSWILFVPVPPLVGFLVWLFAGPRSAR
mgnify:CR=1 FL=1